MAAGDFILTWTGEDIDSKVRAFELSESEGDFAALTVEIPNPRVGLLAPGRSLAAVLQWDSGSGLVDMFAGRLVGIPQSLQGETVSLTFLGRPEDFEAQKIALAETLKEFPFYDPVFVPPERIDDPDVVLEARPQLWHIDRVTGEVSVSDYIAGEAGTLELGGNFFYDSLDITYSTPPLTRINFTGELSWNQAGQGAIDLSPAIEDAFAEAGYQARGYLATYTGSGMIAGWPRTGQIIGSGWKVGYSFCRLSEVLPEAHIKVRTRHGGFKGNSNEGINAPITLVTNPGQSLFDDPIFSSSWIPRTFTYSFQNGCANPNFYNQNRSSIGGASTVGFSLWALEGKFQADYDAERARKEIVRFSIGADVQPIVTSTDETTLEVSLSSSQIGDPVDPGGAFPVGDLRRKSYMLTDRGKQSLAYMIVYCRAKLLARARAVAITFETAFANVAELTLRHSVTLVDDRLPGGTATGKVTGITYALSGDTGALLARVTLGCTIGRGASLDAPAGGSPTYVEDGYIEDGYFATTGGATEIAGGDIQFENYDETTITDDGVDFFDMRASQVVLSLVVVNGAKFQEYLLTNVTYDDTNSAIATLNEHCTKVALALRPLTVTEAFETPFDITVSDLMIPKTLDLEAEEASS